MKHNKANERTIVKASDRTLQSARGFQYISPY